MSLLGSPAFLFIFVSAIPVFALWLYTNVATYPLLTEVLSNWLSASKTQAFCLPPGPASPPPRVLPTSSKFDIPQALLEDVPWSLDTSVAVKASIGDITVVVHERSAPGREVGQSLLDTSLRIGSVTKIFTMLAILLSADKISLSDPITRFVPELNKKAYKDITIAALASHTSGLGRYIFVGDLSVIPGFQPAALGLPSVNSTGDEAPACDPFPGGRVCTRGEIFAGLNSAAYYPRSTHSGPLYSNIGYTLLGMALEAVHNKSSEQVIRHLITNPLNLNKTSFTIPTNDSLALLPRSPADRGWFVPDFGNYNPSGGLWSTPNNLLEFLQSILSHKLLSQHETRRWLHPRAHLPSLHQSVGESWEILRPADLDVKTPRLIDIFTKTGGVTGYAAYTAIVPEYNIALTINAAGGQANNAVSTLFPAIVKPLVAYADKLAQEQMSVKYAGVYRSTAADMTNELTLTVDDGPGLAITDLVMNGVPVLRSLAAMQKIPYESFSARLYPSEADSSGTQNEVWRILVDKKHKRKKFAELECMSWNWGDMFRYVTEPLDTVIFTRNSYENVSVELPGWRAKLDRV
ncbi:Beta-lactamase-like protein-like protein 1 [Stagonosporopsis vannaccii]|nr:Beta-lactamase-like protein-like protein 1 [Stagonosporopsis vannaccii]